MKQQEEVTDLVVVVNNMWLRDYFTDAEINEYRDSFLSKYFQKEEVFILAVGISDYHEISNFGRVRNIKNGKILKERVTNVDYVKYKLKGKEYLAHRLVAIYFIPNPDNKKTVNHIDGDTRNNRIENLEWCTQTEQMHHAVRTGLLKQRGEDSHFCKLKENEVSQVLIMLYNGKTCAEIARFFGVARTTISNIKHGQNWKHLKRT